GTLFKTEDDILEFLKDTSDALRDVLRKMKDKLEFGLKVNWDRDQVLADVEQEFEEIRRLKAQIESDQASSTYFARMQLGQRAERGDPLRTRKGRRGRRARAVGRRAGPRAAHPGE